MNRYSKILSSFFMPFLIASCSLFPDSLEATSQYPKSKKEKRRDRAGKITGEGIVLFGGKKSFDGDEAGGVSGIGVNSYLWRASLDTLAFMPLASADPFGGVIITDWYEDPSSPGERFKVNVVILDTRLRSNAIKVSLFKQILDKNSVWRDSESGADMVNELENKILTKAKLLLVEKESLR